MFIREGCDSKDNSYNSLNIYRKKIAIAPIHTPTTFKEKNNS